MYVTNADRDARGFADAVARADRGLKPLSVAPKRLTSAVRSIRPCAIVLDSQLNGELPRVLEAVERHARGVTVLSERDLPALGRLLEP